MIQSLLLVGGLIGEVWAAPPPDPRPLQTVVVEDAAFPTIALDIVPPNELAAEQITAAMVTVGGDPVSSLDPIDPATTAVAVVIDDRPDLSDTVVQAIQGAAVELARNLGDGTQVAVFTPSGLQTVLSEDKDAAIARVAGIVAGAPDVVALPQVLLAGTQALQAAPASDRHLVVLLGADLVLDDAQRAELSSVVDATGARLHLVTSGSAPSALSEIARATGGVDAATAVQTAGADQVTTAIVERYRAVVTVATAGPQEVVLEVDGERFTTNVDVVPPPASPAPPAPPTPTEAPAGAAGSVVTTAVADVARAPTTNAAASAAPSSAASSGGPVSSLPAATDAGGSDSGVPVSAILLSALFLAVAAVTLVLVWRPNGRRRAPAPAAVDPTASDEPAEHASSAVPAEPDEPVAAIVPVEPASPVVRVEPEAVAAPEVEDPPAVVPTLAEHDGRPSPAPQVPRSPVASPGSFAMRHDRPVDKRRAARRSAGRPAGDPVRAASRDEPKNDDWIESGDLRMSPSTGEVWSGRRRLSLTAAEADVLHLLLTQRDRGLTAEEILQAAGRSPDEGPRAAELVVAKVRRRVGLGAGRGQAVRKEHSVRYYFDV